MIQNPAGFYAHRVKHWIPSQVESDGGGGARSLAEGGEDLLTFLRFPKSQWIAIRTTNIIERINQDFRRPVKTQVCFPTEMSLLLVLFGLVVSGMIRMRRMDGYEDLLDPEAIVPVPTLCNQPALGGYQPAMPVAVTV